MATTDFKDSGEWRQGPQTPQAKRKVSEVTRKTKTGVWSAKEAHEEKKPYAGMAGVNYSEMVERMGIEELIETPGILSEVLQLFVRRAVMERLFFTEAMLAQQRGDEEKRNTYAKYHQTYSKGAINDGLKLMEVLQKSQEGVLDYEAMLNDD